MNGKTANGDIIRIYANIPTPTKQYGSNQTKTGYVITQDLPYTHFEKRVNMSANYSFPPFDCPQTNTENCFVIHKSTKQKLRHFFEHYKYKDYRFDDTPKYGAENDPLIIAGKERTANRTYLFAKLDKKSFYKFLQNIAYWDNPVTREYSDKTNEKQKNYLKLVHKSENV